MSSYVIKLLMVECKLMSSLKESLKRVGHMESEAKRIVYKDGDGSRKRLISTRSVGLSTRT